MSAGPPPLRWGADALWRQLSPLLPGLSVEVLARCESTNTELLARARAAGGEPGQGRAGDTPGQRGRRSQDVMPCLLVAEQQTHGRGRLGRHWLSGAGRSLTFSLALPLAPVSWSGLSLAVGCALADALDPRPQDPSDSGTARIALKWPNDLWLWDGPGQGRKLGGILIETVTVGAHRMVVIGIGLNLQPLPASAEDSGALSHGQASLAELAADAAAPEVLARIALPLVQAVHRFEAQGFAPFSAAYARRDLLAGQAVTTHGAGTDVSAVADGVAADGALRLRLPGGRETLLSSGEVSVRLQAPPAADDPSAPC